MHLCDCNIFFFLNQVLLEEKLPEKAAKLEKVMREELEKIPKSQVTAIRGRGLMFAIDVDESTYKGCL